MLSQCPHCHKEIKLNEAQQAKVEQACAALTAGKTLKLGCPHCKTPIELDATGMPVGGEVMESLLSSTQEEKAPPGSEELLEKAKKPEIKPVNPPPEAPRPPDVSWLASGELSEKAVVADIPKVLVLMGDGEMRATVSKAFEARNYLPVFFNSSEEAIEDMRFTDYAAVVFHSRFEGASLADSQFHDHMRRLSMNKRRYIYYVLIGPEFRTLYDLEALAASANLVVNDDDVRHITTILQKGFRDYDELFGPYLKALKEHGKK